MRKPPVSPKQLQASCWEQQPISHIWNSRLALSTSAQATGYLQTGRGMSTSGSVL